MGTINITRFEKGSSIDGRRVHDLLCSMSIQHASRAAMRALNLTGNARPQFFESFALLEKQVRRARSDDGRL